MIGRRAEAERHDVRCLDTLRARHHAPGAGLGDVDDQRRRVEGNTIVLATRSVVAVVEERDAQRPPEPDAGFLDRSLLSGRDRRRAGVVVRAASRTKAPKMPSTAGDIPLSFRIRSGCHCTPTNHRYLSDSNASTRSPTRAVARRAGLSSFDLTP